LLFLQLIRDVGLKKGSEMKQITPRIPVILDTDIGTDIDDTWALAMLLRCPELDVRLILSDTGNTEYRARIIARLLGIGVLPVSVLTSVTGI